MTTEENRNKSNANLKPVKKGEVRNPNGRPKGARGFKNVLREILDMEIKGKDPTDGKEKIATNEYFILAAQVSKAIKKLNTKSAEFVRDTMEGKPAQEVKGNLGGTFNVIFKK